MGTNVGIVDRTVRVVAGLLLLWLMMDGRIGPWGWLGLIPLITGVAGVCPLYGALGISTKAP
ncbi:DUF2892 domain-containing protein [Ramlibacter sp. CrO1]|uniref:DUF2892 domain-containing protein n=2 Tax=Ramlibacter algicola TaxID=2795217 RepID=A0A934URB8_9BURK|nr:DUF2892 domain-containing protein [Ramlibacter algicola]MBK0392528.1 DUF2892 domain-containing protein [Ramlibacter algicola]